jgi:hypothetical protein
MGKINPSSRAPPQREHALSRKRNHGDGRLDVTAVTNMQVKIFNVKAGFNLINQPYRRSRVET